MCWFVAGGENLLLFSEAVFLAGTSHQLISGPFLFMETGSQSTFTPDPTYSSQPPWRPGISILWEPVARGLGHLS